MFSRWTRLEEKLPFISTETKRHTHCDYTPPFGDCSLANHSPVCKLTILLLLLDSVTCGQSYKSSTIVIYDSRVIPDLKLPHITTLKS